MWDSLRERRANIIWRPCLHTRINEVFKEGRDEGLKRFSFWIFRVLELLLVYSFLLTRQFGESPASINPMLSYSLPEAA